MVCFIYVYFIQCDCNFLCMCVGGGGVFIVENWKNWEAEHILLGCFYNNPSNFGALQQCCQMIYHFPI